MRIGHEYASIHNHTTYSFGIDDQEFMTVFECDEPADFMHLMLTLRDSEAPLHRARHADLRRPADGDPRRARPPGRRRCTRERVKRFWLDMNPTVRGFIIILAITGLVVALSLYSTLAALYLIARIAFFIAIAFFIFLVWRRAPRRDRPLVDPCARRLLRRGDPRRGRPGRLLLEGNPRSRRDRLLRRPRPRPLLHVARVEGRAPVQSLRWPSRKASPHPISS